MPTDPTEQEKRERARAAYLLALEQEERAAQQADPGFDVGRYVRTETLEAPSDAEIAREVLYLDALRQKADLKPSATEEYGQAADPYPFEHEPGLLGDVRAISDAAARALTPAVEGRAPDLTIQRRQGELLKTVMPDWLLDAYRHPARMLGYDDEAYFGTPEEERLRDEVQSRLSVGAMAGLGAEGLRRALIEPAAQRAEEGGDEAVAAELRAAAEQLPSAVAGHAGRAITPEEATILEGAGTPIESRAVALVRAAGSIPERAVVEPLLSMPAWTWEHNELPVGLFGAGLYGSVRRDLAERIEGGQPPADAVRDTIDAIGFGMAPLERVAMGTTPEDRGLYSEELLAGRSWPARVTLNGLLGVERGMSAAEDLEAAAVANFGADNKVARNAFWWLGQGISLVAPYELPLAGALGQAGWATRVGAAMPSTEVSRTVSAWKALQGREGAIADAATGVAADRLRRGMTHEEVLAAADTRVSHIVREMAKDEGLVVGESLKAPPSRAAPTEPTQPTPAFLEEMANAERAAHAHVRKAAAEVEAGVVDAAASRAGPTLVPPDDLGAGSIRSMDEWWSEMIRVQQQLASGVPVARRSVPRAFSRAKHAAGEALRALDPQQSVADGYRLVDDAGHVLELRPGVSMGGLDDAVRALLARQNVGDQIWYKHQRITARWRRRQRRKAGEVRPAAQLIAHHDFSLREEGTKIRGWVEQDPRATITADDAMRRLEDALFPKDEALDLLRRVWGDEFGAAGRAIDATDAQFLDLFRDAYKTLIRSHVGSDQIVALTPNIYVTKSERRVVLRQLHRAAEDTGLDLSFLEGARVEPGDPIPWPTDKHRDAAGMFLGRFGQSLPEGATVSDWGAANHRVLGILAGRSADAKWAINGTGGIADAMISAMASVAGGGSRLAAMGGRAGRSLFETLFPHVSTKTLPKPYRPIVMQAKRELEGVGRELLEDMQRLGGEAAQARLRSTSGPVRRAEGWARRALWGSEQSASEVLHELIPGYRPVPARELDLIDAMHGGTLGTTPADTLAQRKMVRDEVRLSSDDRWPKLWHNDPEVIKAGLFDYVTERQAEVVRLAQRLLEARIPSSASAIKRSTIRNADVLSNEQLVGVWRGFLRDGIRSPAIADAMDDVLRSSADAGGRARAGLAPTDKIEVLSDDVSMVRFGLELKAEEIATRVYQRLLEADLIVANPRIVHAIKVVLGRAPKDTSGTSRFPITRLEYAQAEGYIRRWGMDPGLPGGGPERLLEQIGPGWMPRGLREEIEGMRARGAGVSPEPSAWKAAGEFGSWAFRTYKQGVTTVSPDYHLGVVVGIPYAMSLQLGARNAARISKLAMRDQPRVVARLSHRLGPGPKWHPSRLGGTVLVTDTLNLRDLGDLERSARRHGVGHTWTQEITARQIETELARSNDTGWQWNMLTRNVAGLSDGLQEASAAIERHFRTATFLDAIKRGASDTEAAQLARVSNFDYTELSNFDRAVARWGMIFWAYHRKSLDALIYNGLTHPHRVGRLLRVARDQRGAWGEEDRRTLGAQTEFDLGRQIFWRSDELFLPDGSLDPRARGIEYSTVSVNPVTDSLALIDHMLSILPGAPFEEFSEGAGMLGGEANPIVAAIAEYGFEVDLGQPDFRNVRARGANKIPEELYEIAPGAFDYLFDVREKQIHMGRNVDRADFATPDGRPAFWAPSEDRALAWRQFDRWVIGRRLDAYSAIRRMVYPQERRLWATPAATVWDLVGRSSKITRGEWEAAKHRRERMMQIRREIRLLEEERRR